MSVSLRQLEYFVAVVDQGSFTAAAAKLHVSQPGLSHQIQALERMMGGPLLERLPRSVRLTPAGRVALPHARASLAHAERAQAVAQRASGLDTGELHVGTLYSISVGILPAALREWRARYPQVQVRLVEFRRSDDLIAVMEAGGADLGVGPLPPPDWPGPITKIGTESFVVVGAAGTALPGDHGQVAMADLADRPWVHFTPPSGLADVLDTAAARAGFQPHAAVKTEQAPSAVNLATAGLGLTLVPGNVLPPDFDGVVRFPQPAVERELCVYTRVSPDPITQAFVTAIADQTLVNPPHVRELAGLQGDCRKVGC